MAVVAFGIYLATTYFGEPAAYDRYIQSIAFSRDGRILVADVDHYLFVWEANSGKLRCGVNYSPRYGAMTLGGIEMLNSVIYGIPMAVTSPVNSTTLAYLDGMRDKLVEGLDLVTTGTGNNMKMVLGNLFDLGGTPISADKTAAEKANIRAHIIEWNNRVAAVAAARSIPILDWWGWLPHGFRVVRISINGMAEPLAIP